MLNIRVYSHDKYLLIVTSVRLVTCKAKHVQKLLQVKSLASRPTLIRIMNFSFVSVVLFTKTGLNMHPTLKILLCKIFPSSFSLQKPIIDFLVLTVVPNLPLCRALQNQGFEIVERGKIEVKGKGKMTTYILSHNLHATENEIMGRAEKQHFSHSDQTGELRETS